MKLDVMYRVYKTVEVDDKFKLLNLNDECTDWDEYEKLFSELETILTPSENNTELAYVCDCACIEPIIDR